ncbi:MAG: DinB family protein [Anaerolineae bacterium]
MPRPRSRPSLITYFATTTMYLSSSCTGTGYVMNADAFRHYYEYHFAENRKIWDTFVVPLSQEQFTHEIPYSMGSVRNQLVHLMSCDDYWFSGLRGYDMPDPFDPADFNDRDILRAQWDSVEADMRGYLAQLQDAMLFSHPLGGEDEVLMLWQVLLHVANHGTDHRSQILRLLNDLGLDTGPQDYIFYIYDNL